LRHSHNLREVRLRTLAKDALTAKEGKAKGFKKGIATIIGYFSPFKA